jgi:hypothetical protein
MNGQNPFDGLRFNQHTAFDQHVETKRFLATELFIVNRNNPLSLGRQASQA